MKIGNQRVHRPETVTGINENSRLAAHGTDSPVLVGNTLQSTTGSRPDGNHPASRGASGIDQIGTFTGDRKILGVHNVFTDVLHLDRTEGSQTDMKHHGSDCHALLPDFSEQFFSKMQSRRGCRRTSLFVGVYRLIAVIVAKLFGNVGRKRHQPDFVQNFIDIGIFFFVIFKSDQAGSLLDNVDNFTDQHPPAENETTADLRPLAGFHEGFPCIRRTGTKQKKLYNRVLPPLRVTIEPCGDNFGVVDNEDIPGVQHIRNIIKMFVFNVAAFAVYTHQPGMIARLNRRLSDPFLGQVIEKIRRSEVGGTHGIGDNRHESVPFLWLGAYTDNAKSFKDIINLFCRFCNTLSDFCYPKGEHMEKTRLFEGAATALITPFSDGRVDFDAYGKLIERQIESGIDALVVTGTTGEAPTLTDTEHRACIAFAVRTVAGRVPVIAGTGSNDTAHAIEMSRFACRMGCDGLLLVTPYYNRATAQGLAESYRKIADETDRPILLYNVPSRTGVWLSAATLRLLADHPRIVGIKEASGDIGFAARLAAEFNGAFDLYSGNDDLTVPTLSLGGRGVISVLSNLFPHEVSTMCRKYREGDIRGALADQLAFLPLIDALFAEVNPIPVKCAAAMLGLCKEEYRLPLCPPSAETRTRLSALLQKK